MLTSVAGWSQCQPYIRVDGNIVIANQTTPTGITLPLWLREGQTLAAEQMVHSISVIEFSVNGTALEFSDVLSVTSTTPQAVPAGKVWKVESIVKQPASGTNNSVTYTQAGTYTFTVPSCANYICIEVWGGGGGGGGATSGSGGAGGGGGYGQGCFVVTPGSNHTVQVGAGGGGRSGVNAGISGGTSSVGTLISATGGGGGAAGGGGLGGAGGTSTAPVSFAGGSGGNGNASSCNGGSGGAGGNGGVGGQSTCNQGNAGTAPGGGGSSGNTNGSQYSGGSGALGRVLISW
jgi:hypothetical protein